MPLINTAAVTLLKTCGLPRYERACIEEWFDTGATTSPTTNEPLDSLVLLPNHALRKMIQAFLDNRRDFQKATENLTTSDSQGDLADGYASDGDASPLWRQEPTSPLRESRTAGW